MKSTPAIENFFINQTAILPLQEIVQKLQNSEFRNCDISWLNSNLEKFATLALKSFGINQPLLARENQEEYLNDFVRDRYLSRFNSLLKHFQSFLD